MPPLGQPGLAKQDIRLKRHSRTLGARPIARSLSFGSSAAIASRRRTDFRVAPARFWSQMRRYDPHVSWPYAKCNGARVDGERCHARVDSGGVYCHHHDPARKSPTSTPTASATEVSSLHDPGWLHTRARGRGHFPPGQQRAPHARPRPACAPAARRGLTGGPADLGAPPRAAGRVPRGRRRRPAPRDRRRLSARPPTSCTRRRPEGTPTPWPSWTAWPRSSKRTGAPAGCMPRSSSGWPGSPRDAQRGTAL